MLLLSYGTLCHVRYLYSVSCYALTMRCLVLRSRVLLPALSYEAEMQVKSAISLRVPYAVSGTGIAYAAISLRALCDVRYWHSVCDYLPTRALRDVRYWHSVCRCSALVSGTEIAYAAMDFYAESGSEIAYAAMQSLKSKLAEATREGIKLKM
eukprot:1066417-Rhodomonas_salina.1